MGNGTGGRAMPHRRLAARAAAITGAGVLVAVSACASGGGKDAVCEDTRRAFAGYAAQLKTIAPTDQAPWQQATEGLAARLDGLAARTDDAPLKKALKGTAVQARSAATAVGSSGDTEHLQRMIAEQPARIGRACA